jgi:hypothetical protein
MQRHLVRGQLANPGENVQLERPQDVLVALLVPGAVRVVPLAEQSLDGLGLQDRLLLQPSHDARIASLLNLATQPLRFGPGVLQRQQRVAAEIDAVLAAAVVEADLEGDLSLRRDAHTEPIAVRPLFQRRALLARVGLQPSVRQCHAAPVST